MNDRRRFGKRRGPGKRTFRLRFFGGRLKREDIRCAEVAADLLGHDVVALGQESAFQGTFDLQHPRIMEIVEGSIADPCPVDRKSTRLNSSHLVISYAVFCLKKKKKKKNKNMRTIKRQRETV